MVLTKSLLLSNFHRGCFSFGKAVVPGRSSFCTLAPLHRRHHHHHQQQQQQRRSHATKAATASTAGLRRPRNYQGPHDVAGNMPNSHLYKQKSLGKLEDPQSPNFEQASLSPWVPLPDVVARRALELANAGPDTIHVDLGSGDGRLCFHALQAGVASSTGIDVDANMIETALTRLAKRHPQPDNLRFIQADLLLPNLDKLSSSKTSSDSSSENNNSNHQAWGCVQQANLITMYFATPGLVQLRPLLERQLIGKTCTIITAGYEMPGWEAAVTEVVLGTQLHVYHWGATAQDDDDDEDEDDTAFFFPGEDILTQKLETGLNPLESDKFQGANVIDHTGRFMIRGFNPDIFDEEEDDDAPFISDDEEEDKEVSTAATKKI